jgi:hypothetical protein
MHAAKLKPEMFQVTRDDQPGAMEKVFSEWDRHDRFGIVIHETWGAMGASLLIQGTIAEFYRARRAVGIKDIYPEIYAFHVGRDFGDLSMFDFWPFHKEVVVANHPASVLQAINDRAITRLAVPVGRVRSYNFMWPEWAAAKDRVRTVIGYHSSGVTPGADIRISATTAEVENNTQGSFDLLAEMKEYFDSDEPDSKRWIGHGMKRLAAVTAEQTQRARELHQVNVHNGLATESYLSTDLDYALGRLVPG